MGWEVVHRAEGSSCHSRDTDYYSRGYLAARVDSVRMIAVRTVAARTVAAQGLAHKNHLENHLVDTVAGDEKDRCPCGQESHRELLADHPRPGEGWFEASLRQASAVVAQSWSMRPRN